MLPTGRRRNTGRTQRRCWLSFNRISSLLYVSWETEIFNDFLFHWGLRYSRYLKPWFNLGIGFGLLSMIMSVCVMILQLTNLYANLSFGQGSNGNAAQTMTMVVPGVNMPWSELPYMISASIFAVGFHELGHALAAASEGICIEYVAIFLACLIPGALVALNEDTFHRKNSVQALRVYSAGIWHNFLCCFICYLIMLAFPVLLSPFYIHSESPVVLHIDSSSPLEGYLRPGDIIFEARGRKVQSFQDWVQILEYHSFQEPSSLVNHIAQLNESLNMSSETPYYISSQGYCALRMNFVMKEKIMHIAACLNETMLFYELASESTDAQSLFCLNATAVSKREICSTEKSTCSEGSSCMLPVLRHGEAWIDVKFQHLTSDCSFMATDASCHQSLVYMGDLKNLIYSLKLTKFWPRQQSLGFFPAIFMRGFPDALWRLLAYTISISIIMILLNSAPVFYLDGEAIIQIWIKFILAYCKINMHPNNEKKIVRFCLIMGSILCILFLASGVINTIL